MYFKKQEVKLGEKQPSHMYESHLALAQFRATVDLGMEAYRQYFLSLVTKD